MNTLYLITGPAGVGKSTISNQIANNLEKSALIEGDSLYNQVIGSYQSAWKPGNHLKLFWEISFNNIETYLKNGYDVIYNYIMQPETIEEIKKRFKNYNIRFTVLITDEETLLKRDSQRIEENQMKERCLILLESFKKKNFEKRFFLDTSKMTIEETVKEIIENKNYKI